MTVHVSTCNPSARNVQEDNLHFQLWANGAELYPDQSSSYHCGFRQDNARIFMHNVVSVIDGTRPSPFAVGPGIQDGVHHKGDKWIPGVGSIKFNDPWANAYNKNQFEGAPQQWSVMGPIQAQSCAHPSCD